MIKTNTDANGNISFTDDRGFLSQDQLAAVQAAMGAGLDEFTTPTDPDDQGRISWSVRTWVVSRNGKTQAFLVAFKTENAHFEIMGPEVDLKLAAQTPPPAPTATGKRKNAN